MSWNKVFSKNPKQFRGPVQSPTLRARAVTALDSVDSHLGAAQRSLQGIYEGMGGTDPEAYRLYNDIYDRLEQLRRRAQGRRVQEAETAMTWRSVLANPHRVREMPLPGGPPPEEREALQAVHAQLEGLTKTQALRVLHTVAEQVRRDWP